MPEPTANVTAARVMMSPVQDAALIVPLVLAEKCHAIAFAQVFDAWREIDIMGYEQGLVVVEPEQESLVPATVEVVSQYLLHRPHPPYLDITALRPVGLGDLTQIAI